MVHGPEAWGRTPRVGGVLLTQHRSVPAVRLAHHDRSIHIEPHIPLARGSTIDPVPAGLATALHDRYRIDRELGAGGMATVYLAEDLKHRRKVAVKVLRPEMAAALGSERFLREITTTANLRHPHILPLYDSGESAGFLFYVMPYVVGESLRDRLAREGQIPIEEALRITREVAGALASAHAQGVVHRDIKPENIMLEQGQAILADFGIAREEGAERLTEHGLSIGTPTYMSPEQSLGETELDGRSDIYSLGCVLYEMLAGEPPYVGRTAQTIIAKRLRHPVPRVSTLRQTVALELEATVTRMLAKSPAERFASAAELVSALSGTPAPERLDASAPAARVGRPTPTGTLATAPTILTGTVAPARRSRTVLWLVAGLLLLAAAAGVWFFT